jgi:hypothetical protein
MTNVKEHHEASSEDVALSPRDNRHGHHRNQHQEKPFYGMPIVGFFGQRNRLGHVNSTEATHAERQPILHRAAQTNETRPSSWFGLRQVDEEGDEELSSFSFSRQKHRTQPRSGKQLWAILRRHVHSETFHISDDLITSTRRTNSAIHFDEGLDLPYDFTLLDCLLALFAYLAISVIAFSFVFEKWTVVDSMYFAVVTFTTIGTKKHTS